MWLGSDQGQLPMLDNSSIQLLLHSAQHTISDAQLHHQSAIPQQQVATTVPLTDLIVKMSVNSMQQCLLHNSLYRLSMTAEPWFLTQALR
jgi:hypothetical protein